MDELITLTIGTTIRVSDTHGPDWFPLYIGSGLHETVVYLRRAQLHALRLRLDEIDDETPRPLEGGWAGSDPVFRAGDA